MDIRVFFGFGLGLVLASLLLLLFPSGRMNSSQIEDAARDMGMVYPQEVLTLQEREALETVEEGDQTGEEAGTRSAEEAGDQTGEEEGTRSAEEEETQLTEEEGSPQEDQETAEEALESQRGGE